MTESHPHSKDTGTNTTVIGDLVSDNGTACNVHDEPDVSFDIVDFDIGFVSSKNIACFVVVMVDKGFDTDCSCFAIISDLLMGDADVIKVFECLSCFP